MNARINPQFVKNWPVNKLTAAAKRMADEQKKDAQAAVQLAAYIVNDRITQDRDRYIAGMAAAFLDETGLKIDDVRLIQQTLPNGRGVAMWFEKKPELCPSNQESPEA